MARPKPYIYTDNNPYSTEDYARSVQRLKRPEGKIDMVLDSDMFNEIDDQFALAYTLQAPEKLNLLEIYAAPFYNHHSDSAEHGMELSYEETFNVLTLLGRKEEYEGKVYKGSTSFLKDENTYVESAAARRLVELSKNYTEENPLYVVGIAACTNIVSAILMDPTIVNRIFVVWLGGLGFDWHDNYSFNAGQDVAAARVLLNSGAPVVLLPGKGVLDHFATTGPELEYWLKGKNAFCDYMVEKTREEAMICNGERCWSRPIWDVGAVAWLMGNDFMLDRIVNSPVMEYDHLYSQDYRRLYIRYVYSINRDKLMGDLFERLSRY